jgi:hypothetical protein
MENQYVFSKTSSEEIDNIFENDLDIREGNERKYLYPHYLYELIKEYNYEWTRAFHTLFSQIISELGEECYPKSCSNMTAEKNWEYNFMNYGKQNLNYCAIYCCLHTLDTTMILLTNPTHFSNRENIREYSALVFPRMMRYLCRILAHIYYHHRKQFV